MSSNSVLNAVQHYQRSIEKNPADVARLLHCVGKLYKIPITVELLQLTGVGRTVNALRKHEGELAVAAEAVVNKWKQLVATENDTQADNASSGNEQDSDEDEENHSSPEKSETVKAHSSNHMPAKQNSHSANETEKLESNKKHSKGHSKNHETASSSSSHKNQEQHSKHKSDRSDKSKEQPIKKDPHKGDEDRERKSHSKNHSNDKIENSKEKKHHREHKRKGEVETPKNESNKKERISKEDLEQHSSSSQKKHKHHDTHRSSRDKEKTNLEKKIHSAGKSASANTDGPSTSTAVLVAEDASSPHKKRRHEDSSSEKERLTKKPKSNSQQPQDKKLKQKSDKNEGDIDDGIDSSMGANFADVLGMLNMPQKRAKKSLDALKNTSPKSVQKTPESDKPKSSSSSKTNDNHRKMEMPTSSTSQSKLEKKPELLTSKAKLAPLDPSLVLDLPVISNNYKPLPLNPMVMDCVFNSTTSSSSRAPPPRSFSDAEAWSHGISSKTMRTKVYSGVKTGQLLQVPTLFDLCIRVLQKNIDALEYTGGVPFDVLRSVLERATPQQLFNFEEYNPYVMEDSDVLWKIHVERNYRGHKREEMESWREMFLRCQEDQERRLNMLAENIKQSQKAIALPVRKTQLAFVDSMVKPPRNVLRKQEQYGTKSKPVATPAARVPALCSVTPNAAKQGDARLRVAAAFSQDPVKLSSSFSRPKKAPLMAKTLQFMRGHLKR